MKRNPEAVAEAIREARKIAIVSHVNPDGDTIGCAAAMRLGLLSLGKEVEMYCEDPVPEYLAFLPGVYMFRTPGENDGPFDLLLSVDVSDIKRMGKCEALRKVSRKTAQIDHHGTNPEFMEINSVDGDVPAACVLVREQLKALGVELTEDIAKCLYTGISTDTGNFAFSTTSAECFEVMSELIQAGLPLAELNRMLFRVKSRPHIKLLGRALESLTFRGYGQIAVMKLTQKDFEDSNATGEHADTIVNYGLDTIGTTMALLARETTGGMIKMSLRAKEPARVDDVAQIFNGGGHEQAAGITMPGTLDEATERVLAEMERKIKAE